MKCSIHLKTMKFLSLIKTYPSTLIQLADKFVIHLLNYLHVIPNSNIKSCLEQHPRRSWGKLLLLPKLSQVLWQQQWPLRWPQGPESQPQHHGPRDKPGDQFRWEAGPPSEGHPHSSPNSHYRQCSWETALLHTPPGLPQSPQFQPRACHPSKEDLRLVLWGKPAPYDSRGPPGWQTPGPSQGTLPSCKGTAAPALPSSYGEPSEDCACEVLSLENSHRLTQSPLLLCLWAGRLTGRAWPWEWGLARQAWVCRGCNSQSPLPLPQPADLFWAKEGALESLKDMGNRHEYTHSRAPYFLLPLYLC